jgi:hypothetical protein
MSRTDFAYRLLRTAQVSAVGMLIGCGPLYLVANLRPVFYAFDSVYKGPFTVTALVLRYVEGLDPAQSPHGALMSALVPYIGRTTGRTTGRQSGFYHQISIRRKRISLRRAN